MQVLNPVKPLSFGRRYRAEWLFLIAVLLSLAGYLGYSQYLAYVDIGSQQRDQLAHEALMVEKNLIPQIRAVNRALDSVAKYFPSWKSELNGVMIAGRQLKAIAQILPGEDRIMVTDAHGKVIASNQQESIGLDLSQRNYFQHLLEQHDAETSYLAPPFITAQGVVSMELVRVIVGPQDDFNGLVVVGFSDTIFDTLLGSVLYASDAMSYLVHGDGIVYTTMPERRNFEGKSAATPGSLFSRHRHSGQAANVLQGLAQISQTKRLVAFRTIDLTGLGIDKPLVIAVSRDANVIFSHWHQENLGTLILMGLLGLVSSLGLFFFQRRHRVIQGREQLQQQRLQASQARLLTIIESAPECVQIVDRQGHIKEMNTFGLTLIQAISKSQVLDMAASDLVAPEHRKAYRELHQRVLAGETAELEFDLVSLTGLRHTVMMHAVPMLFDGQTVRLSFTRDITQKKQAETELRVAATAFESQEGMVITDSNTVILRVNQAFTDITGYNAEDVVGKKTSLLKSGRHDVDFYRAMWQSIHQTGGWQGEVWDRRKDGEIYPKWLTISAVQGASGAVTHYVGTQHDLTDRKNAEEKIKTLAFFDSLTGLPNRTLLLDRLKQAVTASERSNAHGALLYVDLDNFKTLNDTLGHAIGDLLLQQVAQRLNHGARDGDTVARLSGDGFVVMLLSLSPDKQEAAVSTERVAEKLLAKLSQTYNLGEIAYDSTASIGVTLFQGTQVAVEDLMKQANLAMYQAKDAGRSVVRFFDPTMEIAVKTRAVMVADLRLALDQQQFFLHYQPQVVGSNARVTGAEVLVRWQHPTRGLVSPADFIPLAEETGLILPLGHWVLETACRQLANWSTQAAMADLMLAVNVSARQFSQADFVDQVSVALKSSGANPARLKLELTESLLVSDIEQIIDKMLAIKHLGVSFSLDDFGTGYSSLSYLKRLPLDQLKIDQSFVRDVLSDPNVAAIAKTVVAIGQSLGLEVIAEGVETALQRDFLAQAGCHAYQGYFFSRPITVEAFEAFVRKIEVPAMPTLTATRA